MGVQVETSAAESALDEISGRLAAAVLEATETVGKSIVGAAKRNLPGGPLSSSIGASPPIPSGPATATVKAGPGTAYGRRIEIGYHGTDSLGRGPYHQGGRGFFRRGVNEGETRALSVFSEAISDAIEG